MYVFDTSSALHAWDTYPLEQFPPMWDWFKNAFLQGTFLLPENAFEEISHKSPEFQQWFKEQGISSVPLTDEILMLALRIKNTLDISEDAYHSKGVDENDLFIISTAKVFEATLVSNEGRQFNLPDIKSKYKIPTVCSLPEVAIPCINFIELVKASKEVFR